MGFSSAGYDPARALTVVAFVDAGSLRCMGAKAHGVKESEVRIDGPALTGWVQESHRERVLRSYVYDGRFEDGHPRRPRQAEEHDGLRDTPGLVLRLGRLVERDGRLQQKGVDSLLVLDMLTMAQAHAYDVAHLIAGDADFASVVDAVQRLGKTVSVMAPPGNSSLARELRREADRLFPVERDRLRQLVRLADAPTA